MSEIVRDRVRQKRRQRGADIKRRKINRQGEKKEKDIQGKGRRKRMTEGNGELENGGIM